MTQTIHYLLMELRRMGIKDKKVLEAIEKTKRELFVPDNIKEDSYKNYPLPIGHSQTISQPYTVAFMLELLNLNLNCKVLEIGAGSGYNAAVMSRLAKHIYTIELFPELYELAKKNLDTAGIENVTVIKGNGHDGYKKKAPYDRIIVTCAPNQIPKTLIEQLKNPGVMVLPISQNFSEVMTKIEKYDELIITQHGKFSFVPMQ